MSGSGSTGVIRIQLVPTIAVPAAPTVAELTAGTDLTPNMTRDGWDSPIEGSTIDLGSANDRYNATGAGSYGGQPLSYTGKRDKVALLDVAYAALPAGTTGFIVVRRLGGATGSSADAFVAAQKIETWPIEVITRSPLPIADNEAQKFRASMAVPTPPVLNAVVAA